MTTVIEIIKRYNLKDFNKTYYNFRNNIVPFPKLDQLPDERVRKIVIHPDDNSVDIFCYLYGNTELGNERILK